MKELLELIESNPRYNVKKLAIMLGVDEEKVEEAIKTNGPVYIRLGRSDVPDIYSENQKFEFGKGIELREGNDVTIVATGIMLSKALEASEELKMKG